MPTLPKLVRFVLMWECGQCGHQNYHNGSKNKEALAAKAEFCQETGLDPADIATIPNEIHCAKCEEVNQVGDWMDQNWSDGELP